MFFSFFCPQMYTMNCNNLRHVKLITFWSPFPEVNESAQTDTPQRVTVADISSSTAGTAPWSVRPVRANWRARLHLHLMMLTWNELPNCRSTHIGRSRGAGDAPPTSPQHTHSAIIFHFHADFGKNHTKLYMLVPPLHGLKLLQHYNGI